MSPSWRQLYEGDLQSVYALWLVPAFFMLYWLLSRPLGSSGVEPRAARFLDVYAPLFAVQTVLDPFVTGPLARWLSIEEPDAALLKSASALIGDFRVYLLVFFVLEPQRGTRRAILRAIRWTIVAPTLAVLGVVALQYKFGKMPSGTLAILHEVGVFCLMQLILARVLPTATGLPRYEVAQYVGGLVRYVALYCALWASADLLIVRWASDWGWALRMVPNQLYYAFWIPYAYGTFFSPRFTPSRNPRRAAA
jgi:hypothetical protein